MTKIDKIKILFLNCSNRHSGGEIVFERIIERMFKTFPLQPSIVSGDIKQLNKFRPFFKNVFFLKKIHPLNRKQNLFFYSDSSGKFFI